ncbi:nitroreductase family protein [Fructobacillus sp. M1-13]|uniref:Nitroreductase n=1 Tax=Fructobacillus papyriferae TaxID=2713171 RepID=A0ABS5QS41_9LACO|nr:nitroreductase family protein [Fructobacillus papyriferae]MBS9335144.1 nitroreductase [Fructobacillus papyriferae]MCD2159186.1 nitroreductase family protein [Fructobacillus papyriferae]
MTHFNDLQEKRRSIYALSKEIEKTDDELFQLVKTAIKNTPSAFNSQSVQAVVLTGDAHDKLWDMTLNELAKVSSSEEAFEQTTQKIKGAFQSGYGTVLYFTDQKIVQGLKEQAPLYADNFDDWAEEAVGISLYAVWLALAEAGIGASLQHYNPLIDEAVKQEFHIPENWVLRGEMPFGAIKAPAAEKTYTDDDARFKHFK